MVALFLLFFVVFLYVANLVVFEALASTFLITARNDVFFLAVTLGFLSLGFIISTLLGMRYYNALTRWSYVFFSIWIGVFTYLFFCIRVVRGLVALRYCECPRMGHAPVWERTRGECVWGASRAKDRYPNSPCVH